MILDSLVTFVRKFVVLTEEQAAALALWIAHTHAFEAADSTPYINVRSAEKRSGKTRLLEALALLVARPWSTGRVTTSVLMRRIERDHPTLLLDESDAAFKGEHEYAEALRGMLDVGHRRGGMVSVSVARGRDFDARDFEVYCPKAIAGIGRLPDTVAATVSACTCCGAPAPEASLVCNSCNACIDCGVPCEDWAPLCADCLEDAYEGPSRPGGADRRRKGREGTVARKRDSRVEERSASRGSGSGEGS